MKKLLLLALITFMTACSSSDDDNGNDPVTSDVDNSGLSMVPDAAIEFNDSNFGYYKGVITGSSGNIELNLYNDGEIWAKVVLDGVTYNFTTTESANLGEAVSGLTFTSGNNSFDFNVAADGTNPMITNLNLENHPFAFAEIIKEYSDALVRAYEGTFNGDSSGTFNVLRIENMLYGLAQVTGDENSTWVEGSIGTNLHIDGAIEGGTFDGFVNGAILYGSWQTSDENGEWTTTRSL